MAKFHIKLKMQGLDLEVAGTREDVPVMRDALAHQFAGLLHPAIELAEGQVTTVVSSSGPTTAPAPEPIKRPRRRARIKTSAGHGEPTPVAWRHDSTKYGSPQQSWSNADKAIWTLYVANHEAGVSEMTNAQIARTFAAGFRQAGPIRSSNLTRDLARFKAAQDGKPPLVSEDAAKNPSVWFLTDAGIKHAQALIAKTLGQTE